MTMMRLDDIDLARLWVGAWRPEEPCEVQAPSATGRWDGKSLHLEATGVPMAAAAAVIAPDLAEVLGWRAAAPEAPTIAALRADYAAATAGFKGTAAEAVCRARLAVCSGCALWREKALGGRGRCDYAFCRCSVRLPWLASETCPKGLWKAAEEALHSGSSGA